jgi:hypothetical protein
MTIMNRFDPFGRLELVVPVKWLHRIIRAGMLVVVPIFLVMRIRQYDEFLFTPFGRLRPFSMLFSSSRSPCALILLIGPMVSRIIVPLIGSVLPFALLTKAPGSWILGKPFLLCYTFIRRLSVMYLHARNSEFYCGWKRPQNL